MPLFVAVDDPLGGGGTDPEVVPNDPADPEWLDVTLDLRGYGARSYSRQILAGWAYPSPDNWGLRRWKVRVSELDVSDDHDSFSDGDWRFWILTNNISQEWTKLFDCGGCVHGTESFGGVPWQTGSPDPGRSMGADVLVFPGQGIYFQTAGFEDDIEFEDSIGKISRVHPQEQRRYDDTESDAGDFTLTYEIIAGAALAPPQLSADGRALYDAYVISADDGFGPKLPVSPERVWNLPDMAVLEGDDPVPLDQTDYFEPPNSEPLAIDDISSQAFRDLLDRGREANPEVLDVLLADLAARMSADVEALPVELKATLDIIRDATPTDLWHAHFSELYETLPRRDGASSRPSFVWLLLGLLLGLAASLLAIGGWVHYRRRSASAG